MAFLYSMYILTIIVIVSGDVRRKNLQTGFCLDSNGRQSVYTNDCNDGNYQLWDVYTDGKFINVATGYCLDSNGAGKVYTNECNGGPYQKWSLGNRMVNVATGLCLDSNRNQKVYTMACNGGDFQYWYHRI